MGRSILYLSIASVFCIAIASLAADADGLSRRIDIQANYIVYDSVRNRMLASVGSAANSIFSIDPRTGAQELVLQLPFEPGLMAQSDDGRFLYVAEVSSEHVYRIDLLTISVDPDFEIALGDSQRPISGIVSVVNQPHAIVIAGQRDTEVFDDVAPRELPIPGLSQISRSEDPLVVYQSHLNLWTGGAGLRRLELRADGL